MDVRLARPIDGWALQAVHVRTWQATFRGILPAAAFAERLQQHRQRDWAALIRLQDTDGGAVLALTEGSEIIGLCQYGPTEDPDLDPNCVGQIYRLYVDPTYQARGGGRLLLATAVEALRQAGMVAAVLWVFEADARARGFYEHLGWRPDGARQEEAFPDIRCQLRLL